MFSTKTKDWKTELTELDELFGREPRYPLAAIEDYISYEFENQNEIIRSSSTQIADGINLSTNAICGTLENGFNELISTNKSGFQKVNTNLENIASILTWKFQEVIEQQKITNLLLGNISILLKIPDIQKERQYYVEQGLKFFQNARADKSFYDDSLENLLKAEQIEKTDYFTLQRIGMIYLFSTKHLDLPIAIDYFLKSAKYSYGETHSFSSQTINYLENDLSTDISSQIRTTLDIKKHTANSYLYASQCYYLQKDYKNALTCAQNAYNIVPSFLEAGFNTVKYLCCLGKEKVAIPILKDIILKNKFFSVKAINDADIITKQEVQTLLLELSTDALNNSLRRLKELKSYNVSNQKINEILNSAQEKIFKKNYLASLDAINILNKEYDLNFNYIYYKNEVKERMFDNIDSTINHLSNHRDFRKKVSSTSILTVSELLDFSKNLVNFPAIKKENKRSKLDEYLDFERYYQNTHPKLIQSEQKIKNFVNTKIGNENSSRQQGTWFAAIVFFILFNTIGPAVISFAIALIGIIPVMIISYIARGDESLFNDFVWVVIIGSIIYTLIQGYIICDDMIKNGTKGSTAISNLISKVKRK